MNSWTCTEKSQEDFYTDTCLGPRKNPRAEQEIVVDFLGRKEQRITGAFGEGITVRYWIWLLLTLLTYHNQQ
jgi:hypothetical protein